MKSNSEKIFATLVRGSTYILANRTGGKDKHFTRGKAVEVTAEEREWLRAHAVDRITCLATDSDDIIPVTGRINPEVIGEVVGKDVQKFRFTTEADQAA
jgi:hypothetical protein